MLTYMFLVLSFDFERVRHEIYISASLRFDINNKYSAENDSIDLNFSHTSGSILKYGKIFEKYQPLLSYKI